MQKLCGQLNTSNVPCTRFHTASLSVFLTFYFVLGYSWLTVLWQFQACSKGAQSHINMYPFSPESPSHLKPESFKFPFLKHKWVCSGIWRKLIITTHLFSLIIFGFAFFLFKKKILSREDWLFMCLVWCACAILTHKGKKNNKKSHYRIVTRWGYSIDLVSILLVII